jgi:phosphoglycolate phosphatase
VLIINKDQILETTRKFKNVKTIFFDYDGTIHDSLEIYVPAFNKAYEFLVQENKARPKEWTSDEISYWLGFNPVDMWNKFMPELSDEMKNQCSNIIGEQMKLFIEQGNAVLYNGAIDTLEYLKNKEYHLIFISNCKIYYKETHNSLFHLDQYFETLVCSDEYDFIPKYEILNKIKHNYPEEMVIVGDRFQDMEAGKKNHIYTIGCNYGYALEGELDTADYRINNIKELKKIL